MRLHPTADQASRIVERARRVLIAAPIEQSEVGGESKQEAQLLDPQVCPAQMLRSLPGVGRLDQRFEHIERDGLDAVADRELVALGKLLDRRHEPRQELVVRLDRRSGALGIVRHRRRGLKKFDQGFALDPRGKEVKIQGVSVLPTRKPRSLIRSPVGCPSAVGRAEDPRTADPGTAADDAATAISTGPRRTVGGRSFVVVVIAILHPLPDVARHVVKTERIGRRTSQPARSACRPTGCRNRCNWRFPCRSRRPSNRPSWCRPEPHIPIRPRNRLDALAIARLLSVDDEGRLCTLRWSDDQQCWISTPERIKCQYVSGGDPYAIALSFNLHRRHLTSAQKRDLISKVLARPEVSNATVAKQTMADDKTVAKVRRKLEATSEIPRLEKTTGRDGRSRPATTSRAPSQKAGGIAGTAFLRRMWSDSSKLAGSDEERTLAQ